MFKIGYPHLGDYHIPIRRLLQDLFPTAEIVSPPPFTQKTVELGGRHSPDFVCAPFKYNMGNYIELLEAGANVLLQTGLGCRYGYYGEVQEQILRDLGYDFTFLCFSREKARPQNIYETCKKLNSNLTFSMFSKAVLQAIMRIYFMDQLDYFLREQIGFAKNAKHFTNTKKLFLKELAAENSIIGLYRIYNKYRTRYHAIETHMPQNPLRVGIVGELYTLMEPYSNHFLEKRLAKGGIIVSRKMSASFLLFGKRDRRSLHSSRGYLQYTVGANGVDSVAGSRQYAKDGYDGLIHMKSFGCTPELNAQPALDQISRDYDIPILHLSFDTQTGEAGLETRIEAFMDMIEMKRKQQHEKYSQSRRGHRLHLHKRRVH
ncbi:MAG: hypothetical protein HFE66_03480 [Clostridiales bacterium]|jgi:predicted nucleotide-binding protein (sugar kinase/HSP70/actin superfamily)|nr:hypothetical protein [Clostridiales bacterium]